MQHQKQTGKFDLVALYTLLGYQVALTNSRGGSQSVIKSQKLMIAILIKPQLILGFSRAPSWALYCLLFTLMISLVA